MQKKELEGIYQLLAAQYLYQEVTGFSQDLAKSWGLLHVSDLTVKILSL